MCKKGGKLTAAMSTTYSEIPLPTKPSPSLMMTRLSPESVVVLAGREGWEDVVLWGDALGFCKVRKEGSD